MFLINFSLFELFIRNESRNPFTNKTKLFETKVNDKVVNYSRKELQFSRARVKVALFLQSM